MTVTSWKPDYLFSKMFSPCCTWVLALDTMPALMKSLCSCSIEQLHRKEREKNLSELSHQSIMSGPQTLMYFWKGCVCVSVENILCFDLISLGSLEFHSFLPKMDVSFLSMLICIWISPPMDCFSCLSWLDFIFVQLFLFFHCRATQQCSKYRIYCPHDSTWPDVGIRMVVLHLEL